jgi:hypothetical protein
MTKKNKDTTSLESLLKKNYQYTVEYDYDRSWCECEEDICRCTTLNNARVEKVDMVNLTNLFCEFFGNDEFTKICVNRILTSCHMWNPDCWYVSVGGGYYGEEIEGVYIENSDLKKWFIKFQEAKTNKEKLFVALECEYGYVLDEVKEIDEWNIIEIENNEVSIGQMEHYQKMDQKIVKSYADFDLPRCVLFFKDGKYKLIDGYHRLAANNEKKCKAIVGYKYA